MERIRAQTALFFTLALLALIPGCAGRQEPPPAPATPTTPSVAGGPAAMFIDASSLNVRERPSARAPKIGSLPRAARVEVLQEAEQGWVRVRAEAHRLEGWVAAGYLTPHDPWGPAPPVRGDVPISAGVAFDVFQFTIRNMDDFAWEDAVIYVNPDSPGRGYRYRAGEFGPHSERNLGAWRFRNLEGEKLDPAGVAFEEIRITCDTPSGRGYWVGHP